MYTPAGGSLAATTHARAPATRRTSFLSLSHPPGLMRAHSHRTCAACMHRHRTCSSCLSLPHPPGLMRALAPYARSGAVWAALRVHPRLQPLRVHEHRPRVGPALSESLSFSVSLSLSPVGPKCTRARTARALLATTTRALQQGHFTQTGQHVCLYLERTLGSASHVCALATRRTSFLFLYFSHPPGLIFARSHARPGPPSILNGSLAQTISLFAPKPNLSNSLLCTIFSPQSNKISLFNSSY